MVDHPSDGALVARDPAGREDHEIPGADADVRVIVERDPREGARRLSLAPGRNHDDLIGGVAADVARLDEETRRDAQVSQILRHLDARGDAPADESDTA